MNLDNIKDLWENEKIEQTPEISLEKQKEINLPLEKIRKNMKTEFILSLIFLPLILIHISNDSFNTFVASFLFIILSILITVYYYSKFYSLYKKITKPNFKTYHSLLNLRYELVLNTEIYKSYYLVSTLIVVGYFTIKNINNLDFPLLTIIGIFVLIFTYILGKIWLRDMYGKHIESISKLVNELSDEQDDFQYDRSFIKTNIKFPLFYKTKAFWGKYFEEEIATIINGMIWTLLGLFVLGIISFGLGFLIGYFGAMMGLIGEQTIKILK